MRPARGSAEVDARGFACGGESGVIRDGILVLSEGLRPSNSPTRSLARRFAGALRSRGSLAALVRVVL
jgi:hypothetical protein